MFFIKAKKIIKSTFLEERNSIYFPMDGHYPLYGGLPESKR